ncbi:methyl-accepting chemotaxis protein [Caldimonas brevitalea]|uniref:Methyl-accepting chemotaxis protein n=1 Tax=Caldimonas brevitalea TaxID=413882 RepID=A0A0G3BGM7_9BURK|nr:methyl-accepting chemotaxis protein [Caldimonas brevitalea]AKJ28599.1 methyl-accepting chemotaxis protein [Caldimonas brevitalea]
MSLHQFRIGPRLAIVFGFVIALSILSNVLALRNLAQLQANLDDIVNDNYVKVRLTRQLGQSIQTVTSIITHVVFLDDPARVEQERAKLPAARELYVTSLKALEQMPTDATGKANRARIADTIAKARGFSGKILELAAAGQRAEAARLLVQDSMPATDEVLAAIAANIAYQEHNSAAQYQAAADDYRTARTTMIVSALLCVLLAAVAAFTLTRSITRPLAQARQMLQKVAEGDLSNRVEVDRRDEVGELLNGLRTMQHKLSELVQDVRRNADGVATASVQIAQGNQDLSGRTEQQAASLEQTAASMEELNSTARQNAANANQANDLARAASAVAQRGGEVVGQVVSTMREINDSSRRIADIIGVIDGIAFQTNILALNAAVEAARAGEQGRGFAVVATEVRSLAQRSAGAAKEIKSLIGASVDRVEVGTGLVDQAGHTMSEIVQGIARVTDLLGGIAVASQEQTQGIEQVSAAVSGMDQVTQQNAALVEQAAAAAESLKGQAGALVSTVGAFRLAQEGRAGAV